MSIPETAAIRDVRFGGREVDRIYQNGAIRWNRYNWNKWSCESEQVRGYTVTHAISEELYIACDTPIAPFTAFNVILNLTDNAAFALFPVEGDTWGGVCANGAHILAKTDVLPIGAHFYYLYDVCGSQVRYRVREVCAGDMETRYKRGETLCGTVMGKKGDYPNNGRHGDGYWYVRI